ncbi:MAG: MFS transporter [Cyclobacteriaceae bacterium]
MIESTHKSIRWPQFRSFLILYVSILIGWIAYYNFQPVLLEKYGLASFTGLLFIIQGIILVLVPPLAGYLSDRYREKVGTRFPVIMTGILFAGMVFMAVSLSLAINPGFIVWLLPILIIFWIIAMSIFTSPAISTMELFTSAGKLPRAMSILVVVSGLIYALEPTIVDIIDILGAPLTFLAGGVLVLLSGYWMATSFDEIFRAGKEVDIEHEQRAQSPWKSFLLGAGLGVFMTILFNFLPDHFDAYQLVLGSYEVAGNQLASFILFVSALASLPLGILISRLGLPKAYTIGLPLAFVTLLGLIFSGNVYLIALSSVLFGISYSWLSVCSLPYAMQFANMKNRVLGVGIFFAGMEFPNSIFEAWLANI